MNTRSSRRRTGSPPTASRAGLRARIPSGPLALEPLVSICSVFPWTPSSQEMEPPENPVRFNSRLASVGPRLERELHSVVLVGPGQPEAVSSVRSEGVPERVFPCPGSDLRVDVGVSGALVRPQTVETVRQVGALFRPEHRYRRERSACRQVLCVLLDGRFVDLGSDLRSGVRDDLIDRQDLVCASRNRFVVPGLPRAVALVRRRWFCAHLRIWAPSGPLLCLIPGPLGRRAGSVATHGRFPRPVRVPPSYRSRSCAPGLVLPDRAVLVIERVGFDRGGAASAVARSGVSAQPSSQPQVASTCRSAARVSSRRCRRA